MSGLILEMSKETIVLVCKGETCCKLDLRNVVLLVLYHLGKCTLLELVLSLYMLKELLDLMFEIPPIVSTTVLRTLRILQESELVEIENSYIRLTDKGRDAAHTLFHEVRNAKYVATSSFVLVEQRIFLQELERVVGVVRSTGPRRLFVILLEDIIMREHPQVLNLLDRVLKELVRD